MAKLITHCDYVACPGRTEDLAPGPDNNEGGDEDWDVEEEGAEFELDDSAYHDTCWDEERAVIEAAAGPVTNRPARGGQTARMSR